MPDVPRHRDQYNGGYPAAASGKTRSDPCPARTVGGQEGLHQVGARIPHRHPPACVQGGPTMPSVPTPDDRPTTMPPTPTSPHPIEPAVPSRLAVVADVCCRLERYGTTSDDGPGIRGGHFGRVRAMGVWGLEPVQLEWPDTARHHHIAFKELFAILLACATWGRRWHGARVLCWRDNQAAVGAVTSRSCRDPTLMHLLRCLFFIEAYCQFELVSGHVPGRDNGLADDLSCNRLPSFLAKAPQMDPLPSPFPPLIPLLLLDLSDWTSPAWKRQFVTTFVAA